MLSLYYAKVVILDHVSSRRGPDPAWIVHSSQTFIEFGGSIRQRAQWKATRAWIWEVSTIRFLTILRAVSELLVHFPMGGPLKKSAPGTGSTNRSQVPLQRPFCTRP